MMVESLMAVMRKALDARVYEWRLPIPGLRHNRKPILVRHRFPVKGGQTLRSVMLEEFHRPAPQWEGLFKASTAPPISGSICASTGGSGGVADG